MYCPCILLYIFFIENLVKEKGFDLSPGHKGKVESVCSLATGINIDSTHLTQTRAGLLIVANHKGK
jgi:hypothetical protein